MLLSTSTSTDRLRLLLGLLLAFVLASIPAAEAWGCEGHMLVAEIAKHHLSNNASVVLDAAMTSFAASGPFPKASTMPEAACWMDDIKGFKQYSMNTWHFIDTPYYYKVQPEGDSDTQDRLTATKDSSSAEMEEESTPVPHVYPLEVPTENIRVKLLNMVNSLRKPLNLPHYMIEFALVQILHLMGDIHQPLHCAALVSEAFPQGDRGGNDVAVLADGVYTNLHSLWDNMCDAHLPKLARPLSPKRQEILTAWAEKLEKRYGPRVEPLAESETVFSPKRYATESYLFAINTSYQEGLADATLSSTLGSTKARSSKKEGEQGDAVSDSDASADSYADKTEASTPAAVELSNRYLKRCRSVARQRIVLAGLRLASILNTLFEGEIPAAYQPNK